MKDLEPRARQAPHLVSKAKPVPYELVIPTYQRWMPVCEMSNKRPDTAVFPRFCVVFRWFCMSFRWFQGR